MIPFTPEDISSSHSGRYLRPVNLGDNRRLPTVGEKITNQLYTSGVGTIIRLHCPSMGQKRRVIFTVVNAKERDRLGVLETKKVTNGTVLVW